MRTVLIRLFGIYDSNFEIIGYRVYERRCYRTVRKLRFSRISGFSVLFGISEGIGYLKTENNRIIFIVFVGKYPLLSFISEFVELCEIYTDYCGIGQKISVISSGSCYYHLA